jgi:alpha-L-fucosidase
VQVLAAAESGLASGTFNATYKDGTSSGGTILVQPWWNGAPNGGDIIFPYHFERSGINWNRSAIYEATAHLDPSKELVSLSLPNVTIGSAAAPGGKAITSRLHIFSCSLLKASETVSAQTQLKIQYARSTQKWLPETNKEQIIEVIVNNVGSGWVKSPEYVNVTVTSAGVIMTQPGLIKRLRSGDQAKVELGVVNRPGVPNGSSGNMTVTLSGVGIDENYTFASTFGIKEYEATYESVYTHESPSWYNGAKYGIFIHWGVYAVPGWGNSGSRESYAEWYWYDLNKGPSDSVQTYQYHNKTYGPNVVYDDFIQNFTGSAWSPKDWVDLFADAGATYFVQVSKHHDGYAIFDLPANVSERTSVVQFPHRNFLKELFDAAKTYQPQLHRATYFSLPEWFHPDYKKYGFALWPGGMYSVFTISIYLHLPGNATNPFTNETLPYTGYVPVSDYVPDIILPSMQALADMGTEIMWCDIGGPNMTAEFASAWYNAASTQGRQVTMNNRCGLPGDFDTPEYARYSAIATRKWESNLGMDPYSYGYNRATSLASYMNASSIVQSLVDIVSKNGNFLLDVGPQANGSIIQVEQDNLRQAGTWINSHKESIFNTTYWFITPAEGDLRFTTTLDAFYIHVISEPNSTISILSPIPWLPGDNLTIVGGKMNDQVVTSQAGPSGEVILKIPADVIAADQYVWVFKIKY